MRDLTVEECSAVGGGGYHFVGQETTREYNPETGQYEDVVTGYWVKDTGITVTAGDGLAIGVSWDGEDLNIGVGVGYGVTVSTGETPDQGVAVSYGVDLRGRNVPQDLTPRSLSNALKNFPRGLSVIGWMGESPSWAEQQEWWAETLD